MPKAFENCLKGPHKVFTIKPKGHPNEYIHICKDTRTGKLYHGEVRHDKTNTMRPAGHHIKNGSGRPARSI
jgi:hypothetical protein